MSDPADYGALADRLEHHAKAQRWAMGHSAANACEEAAAALRQAAQERVVVEAATNFVMASDVGDPGQIASCAGYLEQAVKARVEEETDE